MYKSILIIVMLIVTLNVQAKGYRYKASAGHHRTYSYKKTAHYSSRSNSQHERVSGYMRKNRSYVSPYMRTKSNNTQYDNFSAKGNYNPYTHKYGTKTPHY